MIRLSTSIEVYLEKNLKANTNSLIDYAHNKCVVLDSCVGLAYSLLSISLRVADALTVFKYSAAKKTGGNVKNGMLSFTLFCRFYFCFFIVPSRQYFFHIQSTSLISEALNFLKLHKNLSFGFLCSIKFIM